MRDKHPSQSGDSNAPRHANPLAGGSPSQARSRRAYEQTLPELLALADEEVAYLNLDVPFCVTTTLGCLPQIAPLRERIARLPEIDQQLIGSLERYTFALLWAHGLHSGADGLESTSTDKVKAARRARNLLRQHLELLSNHGVISPVPARPRGAKRGQRRLCLELLFLCEQFRSNSDAIDGKTLITRRELLAIEELAHEILTLLGSAKQRGRTQQRAQTADVRNRAFTLFMRAHDETRRAVSFLLWKEKTAAEVLPSLYKARLTRRKRKATR